MTRRPDPRVRTASSADAAAISELMHRFSSDYDMPIDPPDVLAPRYVRQLESGEIFVLLGGDGPDGFAQVRLFGQVYSDAPNAYLEELYVVPDRRGEGLGRALMEAAIEAARERGADHMDLGTSEDDTEARSLYESMGFTNREGKPDGPVMLYYELDL